MGGVLKVAINGEPPTLDWTSSTATLTRLVAWHIFEQLFALDKNYSIKPMLAENYEVSADGLTYTIRLRKGVKFHNGKTMTAADVVASIERWGRVSGGGKATLEYIEGIEKVDEYAIKIKLKERLDSLITALADPKQALIIVPAEINHAAGDKPLSANQLVGTGPFKFDSWVPGQVIELKRFEDYSTRDEEWGGLTGRKIAYVDEVHFLIVKDPQVRLSGLQTGLYDFAIDLQPDMYDQVSSTPNIHPVILKTFSWPGIVFNKKVGLFRDVRLRQAVNYAINKEELASSGLGNPAFWSLDPGIFFPEQVELYTEAGKEVYTAYNPEKARQLLVEAGYKGQPVRIMTTKDYLWLYNLSQELAQQLSQVGFKVDVQVYDWATMVERRNDPEVWDIFITGFSPSFDPTAVIWLQPSWPGWYESRRMQSLLRGWNETREVDEKRRLLEEIQKTVYEELPVIKIANQYGFQAYGEKLKGFEEFFDARFWNVWLSEQ